MMKIILTEKMPKLGNIGDTADVANGYARNYLIPNGRAMRFSPENLAAFEAKKAELLARHESAKKAAEERLPKITSARLHLIRSAGDAGHLYGGVSGRDIARLIRELTGVELLPEQVLLASPIKEAGAWDAKVALHPDIVADIKIFVAQTQDEIDALVAGKDIKKDKKLIAEPEIEESQNQEKPTASEKPAISEKTENKDLPAA